MFVKIELHEIPPFFVSSELENEVIKNMVTEFEKDRSQYGYKNLTLKEKYNTKKEFCKRFNLVIEHDSIISLEIYKQGRTRRWLTKSARLLSCRLIWRTGASPLYKCLENNS